MGRHVAPQIPCHYDSRVYRVEIELIDAQTKAFISHAHIEIQDAQPYQPYDQMRDCKRPIPVSPIDNLTLKELDGKYVGIVIADVPFQEVDIVIVTSDYLKREFLGVPVSSLHQFSPIRMLKSIED